MSCNTLMLGESQLAQQCPRVNESAESAQVAQVLQLLSSNPALHSQLMALLNPSSASSSQCKHSVCDICVTLAPDVYYSHMSIAIVVQF